MLKNIAAKLLRLAFIILSNMLWGTIGMFTRKGVPPLIEGYNENKTDVSKFWNYHTIIGTQLSVVHTAYQSKRYLEWRDKQYPKFHELMGLWGDHLGEVVLDYGCGAGTDMVGFLVYSKAKKVIGVDVSEKALAFASKRIALHNIELGRVRLLRISDLSPRILLDDNTVDHIYCQGVLHHVSDIHSVLRELYRVLKPQHSACVMVYNRDSIYYNLIVPYIMQILQGKYKGMDTNLAFTKSTDTEDCPIAKCYYPQEFIAICSLAGFQTTFKGGYYSTIEISQFNKYKDIIDEDVRLSDHHKLFLKELIVDESGYPRYKGYYAGIGGVYKLYKE